MENRVIFYDGQDVDPDDFNNLQLFTQGTFDDLVADTVSAGQRFAGLAVAKNGVTGVSVGAGRLYSGGKMFAYTNATTKDFLTSLPVAGQRIVTVVAYGTESDTDETAREFLINETTGQSQPKPVSTRHARLCNINFAYGTEAPSPTPPLIDSGYTAIADILLTTTGVASVTMRDSNLINSLDAVDERLGDLEAFEGAVGPKVTSLSSDLAALSAQLNGNVSMQVIGQLLIRVANIEAKANIPSGAASSHADYFLTAANVDLTHPLSNVRIQEGIRFPDANSGTSSLALLNPLDVSARLNNGILFPAYTRKLWLTTGTPSDQVRVSGYSYQTNQMVQKTMTRQVTSYGAAFDVCTNSAFWQSGNFDPLSGIFTRYSDGATFRAAADNLNQAAGNFIGYVAADGINVTVHTTVRVQQFWTDSVTTPYWDQVAVNHNINGSLVAESFLQGQDIWLDAVGLYFTKLADTGDMSVAICSVSNTTGLPDMTSVISLTNLPRSAMQVAPTETVVPITPTFLSAGQRYAVVLITAADHWVATVPGEQFTSGTFFYILDGAYAQGDGTKDLQMNLYRAVPNSTRTSINLNPLQLDGGILGIRVNADAWVPANCTLSYEIQVAGKWYALSAVDAYTLGQGGSVLPLLPFRVTLVGSPDMMPALTLTNSEVRVSRPGTALTCIGKPVNLPAPSSQIHVIQRYENWQGAYHTASLKLLTGGTVAAGSTSYGTTVSPSSFSDVVGSDPIAGPYLERHYVFNLGSAVTSFCKRTDMTTQSARLQFHGASEKDYEL